MPAADFSSVGLAPTTVLVPRTGIDLQKWAVIACDQYSSQPRYWHEVADYVGEAPSTLHLIYPEVFLGGSDAPHRIASINRTMNRYRNEGILSPCEPGVVLVERKTACGTCRSGILATLDLEAYDHRSGATTLIRATEGTVVDRLPPRIRIREQAPLEVPHVMVLIDDPDNTVLSTVSNEHGRVLYDFELMKGGGRVRGTLVREGDALARMVQALGALATPQRMQQRYGARGSHPLLYAMGDGNHSFATAKMVWENIKAHTSNRAALAGHPARYALAEIINIHDPSLHFEPIHRFLHDTVYDLPQRLEAFLTAQGSPAQLNRFASETDARNALVREGGGARQTLVLVHHHTWYTVTIESPRFTLEVGVVQSFLDSCIKTFRGAMVDYIHGDDTVRELCTRSDTTGFFLPAFTKQDLFRTILLDGALPRKSFSMGSANQKRFYLECRSIDGN